MLCLFNFPAYMDCNVGYRIPVHKQQHHTPFDSRSRHRFLSTIILHLCRVGQICLQRPQVLQVTLTGMCSQYREICLLVVCTIGQTLAVINVPMLRALVTEVLRPSKQQNITRTL